ncbi:MAG: EamA family transporter, partial [Sphaerospermopsis kisseleviana]
FLYLGLFDTAGAIFLQVLAQRWVNPNETALMYSMEPIFGAVFSFLLLGEKLGIRGLIGAVFVLVAMIFSQIQSQDYEQNSETQVLLPTLSDADTEPI